MTKKIFTEISVGELLDKISILEIKLSRLTGLERSKISEDLDECRVLIDKYLKILSSSVEMIIE